MAVALVSTSRGRPWERSSFSEWTSLISMGRPEIMGTSSRSTRLSSTQVPFLERSQISTWLLAR